MRVRGKELTGTFWVRVAIALGKIIWQYFWGKKKSSLFPGESSLHASSVVYSISLC